MERSFRSRFTRSPKRDMDSSPYAGPTKNLSHMTADLLPKLRDPHRLGKKRVGPAPPEIGLPDLVAVRGHHEDRRGRDVPAALPEMAAHLEPADVREADVEENDIGPELRGPRGRLEGRPHRRDVVPVPQRLLEEARE